MSEGVLRALPRRATVRGAREGPPPRPEVPVMPRARPLDVVRRAVAWTAAGFVLAVKLGVDRLRGDLHARHVGARLRQAFESLGGPAVKLGQQLSIRVDMLPWEVCEELGRLTDRAQPFSLEHALRIFESSTGRRADDVFAHIEEEPLGSASIACVWRARLHSGEIVAIKVQRPEVSRRFTADLAAFDLMTKALELVSAVRPGFFRHLRAELSSMFLSELDFLAEARFQSLFGRYTRKFGLDWVSAPKLFSELCSRVVLVSEFVTGIPGVKLLEMVDSGDPAARQELLNQGIVPEKVGERMLTLAYYGNEDAPFFHADPHPGNIVVQPGGHIVLLDFGAVGTMDGRSVRTLPGVIGGLAAGEPDLAAAYAVVRMAPYPYIDVGRFTEEAEAAVRQFWQLTEDPRTPGILRTTAVLWLFFLDAVRRYQIPVNLNTLQGMRCSLLYDSLAARLRPDLGFDVFVSYQRKVTPKRVEPAFKELRRRLVEQRSNPSADLWIWLGESLAPLEARLAQLTASPLVRLVDRVERAFQALAVLIRGLAVATVLLVSWVALRGGEVMNDPGRALSWIAGEPPLLVALALGAVLVARHMQLALDTVDGQR